MTENELEEYFEDEDAVVDLEYSIYDSIFWLYSVTPLDIEPAWGEVVDERNYHKSLKPALLVLSKLDSGVYSFTHVESREKLKRARPYIELASKRIGVFESSGFDLLNHEALEKMKLWIESSDMESEIDKDKKRAVFLHDFAYIQLYKNILKPGSRSATVILAAVDELRSYLHPENVKKRHPKLKLTAQFSSDTNETYEQAYEQWEECYSKFWIIATLSE